jgi:hypothetical protein
MSNRRDEGDGERPAMSLAEAVLYETLMDIACDHSSPNSEQAFDACLAFRKVRHTEEQNPEMVD